MKFTAINHFIKAPELRVIDESGKQVGVMTKEAALEKAHQAGIDLVEIAPQAVPPVAKLIDFKKFRYLEAKKAREGSKKSTKVELKEIRFTPFIAQGDLQNRLDRCSELLAGGNRVKVVIKFTGRQITRVEFGHELVRKILSGLADVAVADGAAKLQGKQLFLILNPVKKGKQS